ncbi:ComEC/Rec2 family competence protein [Mariniflexile ostreae]|uniref:ComEC/Rec2 family competence protein n=1 Tax=Mariniflexile ostreae TaxID=1520892 RepID=A0ABV5FC11_9FLAO
MRLLQFTIVKLTFFLIVGILAGYLLDTTVPVAIGISLGALSLLLLFFYIAKNQFNKTIWFGFVAFICMVSIGILTVTLHNNKNNPNHYTHQTNIKEASLKTISFRVREVLKSNRYFDKYIIEVLQVDGVKTTGKLLLNLKNDTIQNVLKVDDYFKCKTTFDAIHPTLNPNQFDYKNYLKHLYIYHQLSLEQHALFKLENKTNTLQGIANNIRTHIQTKLNAYPFQPDELAIINALLLGQREDISDQIYTNYKNAGVLHILALSGLHIGIILWLLTLLLKPLDRFKQGYLIKTLVLVSLLWSFAIIAGLSPSITRAVTMFSIVAIAMNLKRPTNIYNTLAISIFILLLFKPLFLFDVGFQLSYAAVFAIVGIVPYFNRLWRPKNKLVKLYWDTFAVTMAAQFGILPISLYYFHQFPSLFFISNLVVVPFLGLVLACGLGVIFLALIGLLPDIIVILYGQVISIMNTFVGWISQHESFLIKDIPFNFLYVLMFYLFSIALVRYIQKPHYKNLKWFLIAVLFSQASMIFTKLKTPNNTFIVFHKNRYSLLADVSNQSINVATDMHATSALKNSPITDYAIANFINCVKEDPLQSFYILKDKKILVVDSLGVYNISTFQPDYVLLRHAPKINLNRLLDSLKPKQIIADGSNYKSYIENWKTICEKRKHPFHATGEKGAFIIEY